VSLSGVFLGHRLSRDIDLVCHDKGAVRDLVRDLEDAATEVGGTLRVLQDAGTFVRAELRLPSQSILVDVLLDATPDLEPGPSVDGVAVVSLTDLRASKITCLLSRSEPRDLVDLLFLSRAGYPPENDLPLALQKDAGIDPGVLGWLLGQFPVEPLPVMLAPLTSDELRAFRDELRERIRRVAISGSS
jgi:hypothetical protein